MNNNVFCHSIFEQGRRSNLKKPLNGIDSQLIAKVIHQQWVRLIHIKKPSSSFIYFF
ncbi:Uncharacterized protein APZ42_033889 [Daphnia magna]|uniref:Uncharacterized protein n=1 Tax=Daphnia magna TaxID=35525 RepID=A0A0N8E8G7_9CRUS|nr:Uncharacterized protein APZ42_033889 [Daphnia magna]